MVGLGGGLALDYAKFTAWRLKLPLILMPSILSVDAGYTRASGVREQGAVSYVGSIEDHLQHILIDYDVLQSAPALLNSAGAGDILSCFTALYDWKLSADTIAEPYNEDIAKTVQSECLERLYQGAQELAQQTPTGLRLLSELFVAEVRLCEQWGNARPEEGSEHFLGYALEARTKKHYVHGQLIGMCTLIVGAYQGQDVSPVVDCLKALSLDCSFDVLVHFIGSCLFDVQAVGTTRQEMREVLLQVGDYVKAESHLFPGIFHFKVQSLLLFHCFRILPCVQGNVPESQVDSLLDIIDSNFPSA